jgi:hypothetical protein
MTADVILASGVPAGYRATDTLAKLTAGPAAV